MSTRRLTEYRPTDYRLVYPLFLCCFLRNMFTRRSRMIGPVTARVAASAAAAAPSLAIAPLRYLLSLTLAGFASTSPPGAYTSSGGVGSCVQGPVLNQALRYHARTLFPCVPACFFKPTILEPDAAAELVLKFSSRHPVRFPYRRRPTPSDRSLQTLRLAVTACLPLLPLGGFYPRSHQPEDRTKAAEPRRRTKPGAVE